MILNIYSIRDVKSGFLTPTVDQSDQTASRNFAFAIQSGNSLYCKFPNDFDLYRIGTYNTDDGSIESIIPQFIVSASSFIKDGDIDASK